MVYTAIIRLSLLEILLNDRTYLDFKDVYFSMILMCLKIKDFHSICFFKELPILHLYITNSFLLKLRMFQNFLNIRCTYMTLII